MNLQLVQLIILGIWGAAIGGWAYVVYLIHKE